MKFNVLENYFFVYILVQFLGRSYLKIRRFVLVLRDRLIRCETHLDSPSSHILSSILRENVY